MRKKIVGIIVCMLLITTSFPVFGSIIEDNQTNKDILDNNLLKKESNDCGKSGNWQQQDKLIASDGEVSNYFGSSAHIDGQNAVMGVWGDNDNGYHSGSAYIFIRSGTTWSQQFKIKPSDGDIDDRFGYSVSISNGYAIAGSPGDDDYYTSTGSAYIFERIGSSWYQDIKLTPSDPTSYGAFGYSVSIDGDYAIVGCPGAHGGTNKSGAAYIFKNTGSTWIQQAKIIDSDPTPYNYFGISVYINGDYAIVGKYYDDNYKGAAYVFVRSGDTWYQQDKLTASDAESGDEFGYSVCIDGEYAVIGAVGDDYTGSYSGSAYVFKRIGSVWSQQAKLIPSFTTYDSYFGCSVSISGEYALIGAYGDDDYGFNTGAAYVFKRDGTSWSEETRLTASDSEIEKYFGFSVSIDGYYAVIGAPGDDENGQYSGAAYVYNLDEPIPDIPIIELVNIKGGVLGFSVDLMNFGEKTAYDITWEMIVLDGLLFPDSDEGYVPYLEPGEERRIKLKWKFGLGRSTIEFRCHYSISIGGTREEFDVSSKQEYNDLGFLIGHAFPESMQPEKEWIDIQSFEYKEVVGAKGVLLEYENLLHFHNVRVITGLDSGSSDVAFSGLCKFTDGKAFIEEEWITRSDIESALAHWEVELVDGE